MDHFNLQWMTPLIKMAAVGVVIMLSDRMRQKVHSAGSVGTRIVWVSSEKCEELHCHMGNDE